MTSDEAGAIKTMEFQKEVLTDFDERLLNRKNTGKPFVKYLGVKP